MKDEEKGGNEGRRVVRVVYMLLRFLASGVQGPSEGMKVKKLERAVVIAVRAKGGEGEAAELAAIFETEVGMKRGREGVGLGGFVYNKTKKSGFFIFRFCFVLFKLLLHAFSTLLFY